MIIFFKLILFLIFLHQVFFWIYHWQVKEYRLDRFFDSLKNRFDLLKLFKNQYNLLSWFRPKPTFRAALSLFLALIFSLLPLFVLSLSQSFLFTLFIPITASLPVFLLAPIFNYLKSQQIEKAKLIMSKYPGTVIGVTGSFGKSTTKELIAAVLSSKFKVEKTQKNNNSEIGVTQNVLKLNLKSDFFVVEMGAYKIGEIKAICNIVKPKIGIITGLGDQHLSLFGSLENIKTAKYELIKSLPQDGFGIVAKKDFNLDDAKNIETCKDHVEFDFQKTHFSVPLLGQDLISNIIGTIKICQHAGMSLSEIQTALSQIDPHLFYPKLIKVKPDSFLVDDSYNSSLESFLSVIDYLKTWTDYRKIIITPGIIELGPNAQKDHLKIGKNLNVADLVFVTQPHQFSALNQYQNCQLETNTKRLIAKLKSFRTQKTVFLFKGRVPSAIINSLIHE